MDVFIDLHCVPINDLGIFTDLLRVLVDIVGGFTIILCALVDVFSVFTNPLCVLIGALLYRRLSKTLDNLQGSVGCTHLVIRHGNIQISDGTVQGLGMTSVFQELHNPMSLGKRPELHKYVIQLPAGSDCGLDMR